MAPHSSTLAQRRPPQTPAIRSPSAPPAPPREVPPHRPPILTHPWEPRAPSRTTPSTKPTGPCPSSGHQAVSAKLSSEVAGHPAREGAGPGCPRPSPQLPAPPALIWHCPPGTAWWLGGVPRGLGSAGRLPSSSASFSPSQTSGNTFSAPGSLSLLPPPTGLVDIAHLGECPVQVQGLQQSPGEGAEADTTEAT